MNSVQVNNIKKYITSIDWFLVIAVFITMAYGFLLVWSSTNSQRNQNVMIITQAAAMFIGICAMFILSKMDYDQLTKYSRYLYVIGVMVLALTLVIGSGDEVGNRSWIRIRISSSATVGVQPSEIVKIAFILTIANLLEKYKENINKPKNMLILVLHFGVTFALILLAGDLGNNLIYACIFLGMCFVAGVSLWYFLGGAFVIAATSPLWWNNEIIMPHYRQMRILAGFSPASYPDSNWTYQVNRSMQAIGSGGLTGRGYQNGFMTQNGRVPKQWTDFIFSAAGEEFGFLGALLVLILLTVIIARIFYISRNARNNVGSLICVGVMSMFIAQTVENIGMCLGRLPVIGVTLPFFSYGGSSILSSLLGIGLVLSVNSRKHIYYFTREENFDADDF